MKIKLTKEQSDFVMDNYNKLSNIGESIHFQPSVFIQKNEDIGSCLFEVTAISELSKDFLLSILNCIIAK